VLGFPRRYRPRVAAGTNRRFGLSLTPIDNPQVRVQTSDTPL